jgi:hypothetical protein
MLSSLGYSDTGDVLHCRLVTLAKKVENDFDQIIQDEIGCNEMRVMWCLWCLS